MRTRKRVALITGGTRGIGAASARTLAHDGAQVFIAAREAPSDPALIHPNLHFIACDITNDDAVRSLVEEVQKEAGQLDLAVNSAGIEGDLQPLTDYQLDDFLRVLEVNVVGTFLALKYELPAMRATGSGSIVNLASIAAIRGIPNAAAYVASKHAVIGLTKTAALEAAKFHVRVNAICPALVDTAMADRLADKAGIGKADFAANNPMRRLATPEEVAATACWLLSDSAAFISGQALGIDGAQSIA